ncbi:putative armadillo-like helical, pumilio domain-containing protein [Helianthus annuus]|nr:putative armadillo-like helical, pumilio domain-containing protein [Helianthus annuus]KAJ0595907.1 putative armadillo-like helical, pumilio domain-containing protein [Helianthus annuus]KAJ0925540.1 putative armadillo-like helical, pumilio domain-containing protein [Helianthus annuus]
MQSSLSLSLSKNTHFLSLKFITPFSSDSSSSPPNHHTFTNPQNPYKTLFYYNPLSLSRLFLILDQMEHRRNTHMLQAPPYRHYLANAVTFPPLTPPFVSDGVCLPENMSFSNFTNLSPPIDADQSLTNAFSLLNLSPATCDLTHAPRLGANPFSGQIGSSIFSGDGGGEEGFVPPMMGYDDVIRRRWCDGVEAHRRNCSLGFDYGFDFDRNSSLESKKPISFTQHFDDKKLKFKKLDDYEQINYQCGVALSKFYSQNQSQSESQSQNQDYQIMSPWCFKKLRGRIYTMAKDQNGCRILQALFESPSVEEVDIVLSEIVDFISDLMKDQFGNYLVQKIVAVCNDDQKMQIILSLIKDIIHVCMNPHGTRAVQKLLENLQDPNQVKLVMKGLHHGATALAVDPNGHHVIQFCLVNFHTDINMPILTEIANECYKIATDRSGCCVLQACVEHARGEVRTRIIAEIIANSVHLAEDPFGNYVLQHMVGLNIPELTALLVRQLQGNFAALSCNKYGSNVVEKCLNESGEEISTRIVLELIRSPNSSLLLVDPYANFVIQSALKVSKGFAHNCLCGLISKNMWSMQTNLYGKKILGKFNKKKVASFA